MTYFGLTIPQISVAFVIGALLAIVFTFVSTPHVTIAPTVREIAPVPTPPPVVITATPSAQPELTGSGYSTTLLIAEIENRYTSMLNVIYWMFGAIVGITVLRMLVGLVVD